MDGYVSSKKRTTLFGFKKGDTAPYGSVTVPCFIRDDLDGVAFLKAILAEIEVYFVMDELLEMAL